jgi:rhodanese-related sulfurtransferase
MIKKTWILACGVVFLLSGGASCGQIKNNSYKVLLNTLYKKDVPLVSCKEARNTDPVLYLDTRSPEEFKVSHILGARWVGYEEFSLDRVRDIDKHTTLIVYCSVGVRSEKVGRQLMEAGYSNVRNLYGSLFEWVNQGYPVVDMQGHPTLKVHAYSRAWGVWLQRGEKVYE